MSKISQIHDELHTLLANLFTSKKVLTDGLVLENNVGLDLANGYGVSIEDGENTNKVQECYKTIERTITIPLTKEVYAHNHDKTAFKTAEKAMLEDQYKLIMEIESNEALNNLVINADYADDTGIERLLLELEGRGTKQYLLTRIRFLFEYIETNT
jgi:hypothetical protein